MYVYNPSNFSVNYANSAGSAGSATNDGAGRNIVNTYLPLSGGTMSGNINMDNNKTICWPNRSVVITAGSNKRFSIYPDGWSTSDAIKSLISIGYDWSGNYTIWANTDNLYNLGMSTRRWKQVYAVSSTISTSDERLKENIQPLDESLTRNFFMRLNPISYRSKEGDSGRTHWGMGSQSVEKAMEESGISSMDFAGFIKSPVTEEIEVEEEVETESENGEKFVTMQKRTEQREIPGEYRYGLRYEEFIAPTIKMVQMQQRQIEFQTKEIVAMRTRLDAIGA